MLGFVLDSSAGVNYQPTSHQRHSHSTLDYNIGQVLFLDLYNRAVGEDSFFLNEPFVQFLDLRNLML